MGKKAFFLFLLRPFALPFRQICHFLFKIRLVRAIFQTKKCAIEVKSQSFHPNPVRVLRSLGGYFSGFRGACGSGYTPEVLLHLGAESIAAPIVLNGFLEVENGFFSVIAFVQNNLVMAPRHEYYKCKLFIFKYL